MLLERAPVGDWDGHLARMLPWILARYPGWKGWPDGHCYAREYAWTLEQIGSVEGLRILDAGGSGSVLSAVLSDLGAAEVVVADRGDQGVRPYPAERVGFRLCDLQATGLEPGSFDVATCVSALEHNPWAAEVEIVRHLLGLLRPGGRLLVTVPSVPTEQRAWHANYRNWGCVYFWTHAAAREMAEAVFDVAALEVPLLPDSDYDLEWARIDADVRSAWPRWPYPYQSMGLAWRRR